jgi:hypothetical protein
MAKRHSKGFISPEHKAVVKKYAAVSELWHKEPAKKGRRPFERGLVNLLRKLQPCMQMDVYLFAERLALSRIEARKADRKAVRHG